jgi:hypothetical protein
MARVAEADWIGVGEQKPRRFSDVAIAGKSAGSVVGDCTSEGTAATRNTGLRVLAVIKYVRVFILCPDAHAAEVEYVCLLNPEKETTPLLFQVTLRRSINHDGALTNGLIDAIISMQIE